MTEFAAWSMLAAVAGGLAVIVALLVRGPMRAVLTANATLAPSSSFYVRTFGLVVALAAIAAVAGAGLPCEKQSESTMTLIWWAAAQLQPLCWSLGGFLMGYVLLLTVLFAALGRYRDQ
ncbi:MAG: hypothetical protein NTX87_16895 [Planctomycetota bacterium]|nr:hypothetical protein [Planctomycetota bacterium]